MNEKSNTMTSATELTGQKRKKSWNRMKNDICRLFSYDMSAGMDVNEKVCRCCKLDKFDNNPDLVWLFFTFFFSHSAQCPLFSNFFAAAYSLQLKLIDDELGMREISIKRKLLTHRLHSFPSLSLSNLAKHKLQTSKGTKW